LAAPYVALHVVGRQKVRACLPGATGAADADDAINKHTEIHFAQTLILQTTYSTIITNTTIQWRIDDFVRRLPVVKVQN